MNKINLDTYRDAEDSFRKVLDILYGDDELNLVTLESYLDNLCYFFDMNIRVGNLMIEQKKKIDKAIPFINPIDYNKIFEDLQ